MEQTGIVLNAYSDKAVVKIVRDTSCGDSCGSCNLCENKEKIRTVLNPVGAKAGERVTIEMKGSAFLIMAFAAYIFPILAMGTVAWFLSGKMAVAAADFITLGVLAAAIMFTVLISRFLFKGHYFQSKIIGVTADEEN